MADWSSSGSARQEAERLVATALAAAQLAARRLTDTGATGATGCTDGAHSGGYPGGFATGEPQCCVCPICKVIAALRDPSPEYAERLATGAGDFAAGLASLLRAVGQAAGESRTADAAGHAGHAGSAGAGAGAGGGSGGWDDPTGADEDLFEEPTDPGDVWRAATRGSAAYQDRSADASSDVDFRATASTTATPIAPRKPMAKKAVKRAVRPPVRRDDGSDLPER